MKLETITTSYKRYKQNTTDYKSKKDYVSVVNGFMQFIVDKVLDGYDVELSGGKSLGNICVVGKKVVPKITENGNISGLAIDWKATKEYRANHPEDSTRFIFHMNQHTNGVRYRLVWYNKDMLTRNKIYYNFCFPESFSKALSAKIFQGKEYYIKLEKQE